MILVPYHLDERLDGLELDLPGAPAVTVSADFPAEGDIWDRLAALYEVVAERVAESARRGDVPVVVSGDCMVSLGVMAGLQRAGRYPGIVWFDGHGDVQTLETTTSGYVGGMPLRILVGYRPELIADRIGLVPVDEERAVLVDARDLDPAEVEYLSRARIQRYQIQALKALEEPMLVHIDLDVVIADEVPGLRFPVPGGPSGEQLVEAVEQLRSTGRVAAVVVGCTWRPDGGNADRRKLVAALTKGFRKETYRVSNST